MGIVKKRHKPLFSITSLYKSAPGLLPLYALGTIIKPRPLLVPGFLGFGQRKSTPPLHTFGIVLLPHQNAVSGTSGTGVSV